MALPRVCSLGRGLVFRGSATRAASCILPSARIAIPYRSFVSTTRDLREISENITSSSINSASQAAIPEEQRRKNARSVKVLKVPRRATRRQVESIFTGAGFKVLDVHMSIDRFRFDGDTYASVELADSQQAEKAVLVLNGNDSIGEKVYVRTLNPDFKWDDYQSTTRTFPYLLRRDNAGTRKAVQPLIEGRRVRISAKSPAWGDKGDSPGQRSKSDLEVLVRTYERFGIEAISRLAPQFGHTTFHPKFLGHIDFTSKDGAEDAIRATHDMDVEGVRVWARRSEIDPTKAYQIGKVNRGLLIELQEKGLAPSPSEIQEDWLSKSAKKDPMKFDVHRTWTDTTRPPHRRSYRAPRERVY